MLLVVSPTLYLTWILTASNATTLHKYIYSDSARFKGNSGGRVCSPTYALTLPILLDKGGWGAYLNVTHLTDVTNPESMRVYIKSHID